MYVISTSIRSSLNSPFSRAIHNGAKSMTMLGMATRILFSGSAPIARPCANKQKKEQAAAIVAVQLPFSVRRFVMLLLPEQVAKQPSQSPLSWLRANGGGLI